MMRDETFVYKCHVFVLNSYNVTRRRYVSTVIVVLLMLMKVQM